jgi:epoxyqueuosine reductase QueG
LGWFGKNTCLINSRRGSWFVLGLLLTTEHFEPDPPAPGGCGTCRRCVEACPTGAIVLENDRWQVDSRRCLSYRTIEVPAAEGVERKAYGVRNESERGDLAEIDRTTESNPVAGTPLSPDSSTSLGMTDRGAKATGSSASSSSTPYAQRPTSGSASHAPEAWTFGCDVCREVCPFNEPRESQPLRAAVTREPDFAVGPEWPRLTELAEISYESWDLLTRGSAVRRAGYEGLKRNAMNALKGNRAVDSDRRGGRT